ncbi:MAG: ribbon-helix-helix protein, CopG family [Candidatus Nanoarchaeia archaeon]
MGKTSKKTIQIGLRIDEELLKRIEQLSDHEGVDKMTWMRRALLRYVEIIDDDTKDGAVEDYIHLRINEEEFLKIMRMKTVPKDVEQARKEMISTIKKERDK